MFPSTKKSFNVLGTRCMCFAGDLLSASKAAAYRTSRRDGKIIHVTDQFRVVPKLEGASRAPHSIGLATDREPDGEFQWPSQGFRSTCNRGEKMG